MATDRTNIGYKFENGDIPSQGDFQEVFNSFVHKDEDKADFQMVETGTDDQHYVTPALLRAGLQNIGIITGNSYMPLKEHFDNFVGNTITLQYAPVNFSVKVFKNGQLLLEKEGEGNDGDYIINYEMAKITFSGNIDNRNIEVDYWYKNLTPNPGGGDAGEQIDFTSFLHTSGNEIKNGILTFNNTTPASTSGIVLTNSGADAGAKVLDVTVSGAGSGIAVQNTATGTGIKVSNTGAGTGLQVNSSAAATGNPLQVSKDNVVKAKIDTEGIVTAKKFVSEEGTAEKFVKGDGSFDDKIYAEDTKAIHTTGNETKDGALKLTHNTSVDDVLTIEKNNSANCLKLVQNSSSSATTSTFDTNNDYVNRKAISVQKIQVEKAFITHDGNVSGTSFTTLNEKADITDGFITLAASTSATAMAGHAKLYAKTDETTDLYVMGSDGVEKKIGGQVDLSGKENTIAAGTTAQYFRGDKTWQTLDKTAVSLSNIDNTSDLNKPISTATQTALNQKIDSANAILTSGDQVKTGTLSMIRNTNNSNTYILLNANNVGPVLNVANNVGSTIDAATFLNQSTNGNAIRIDLNDTGGGLLIKNSSVSNGIPLAISNAGTTTAKIDKLGNVNANTFVKTGGTASQFLKADGSIDSSAYLKSTDLSNYVDLSSNQSILGAKTFTATTNFSNPVFINNENSIFFTGSNVSYSKDITRAQIKRFSNDIALASANSNYPVCINTLSLTSIQTLTAPNASGTIALTNNPTALTATSFVKTGGTSSQYLMADGSVTTSVSGSAEPSQITVTSSISITTDTLDANGKKQLGKNVIINNGSSAITITVNGGTDFCASYLKHGTGAITFTQASGRTLVLVDGSAVLSGIAGSTATISSVGTKDYLRISNA